MDGRAEYVSFAAWGFWGERHLDLLQEKYAAGKKPVFDSPELGFELVAKVLDPNVPYIDLAYIDWGDDDDWDDGEEELV